MNMLIRSLVITVVASSFAYPSLAQTVRVPGTNVTLAPPEGFSVAQQYPGFERVDVQASIMITELPVPASEMIRSLSKPALASRGMLLMAERDTVIKDTPARLLNVRQKTAGADVIKWMLVGGDGKTTVMVVGTFPAGASPGIGEAI